MIKKDITFWLVLPLFLFTASFAFSANVVVPTFDLITRGYMSGGSFVLATRADMDLKIEGGYKFGGQLKFGFLQENLEDQTTLPASYDPQAVDNNISRALLFKTASVTMREVMNSTLDLTYFTGEMDALGTGEDFMRYFGTEPFATRYRGYRYFNGGVLYDGIYRVYGTGIELAAPQIASWLYMSGYVYQDQNIRPGVYSADYRLLFNLDRIKAETFVGATVPRADYGEYRAGLMMFFDTGAGGQFYTQIGIPRWTPGPSGTIALEDFYFLFEPRLTFNAFSAILTLFWHPAYYIHDPTSEDGALDMNMQFLLGDPYASPVRGGLDSGLRYRPTSSQQIEVTTSPFISLTSSGVIWDISLDVRVFPFDLQDSFQGFVGIKTEF